MLKRKKFWKRVMIVLGSFSLLLVIGIIYLVSVAMVDPPATKKANAETLKRIDHGNGLYTINNNWLRKSNSGLYELYVEGDPYEMGIINGKLSKELVENQEKHFNDRINNMIPSTFYKHFLKYFIGWFNRDLDENVSEEYKEEIYGISKSASNDFEYIGSNYQRLLNYHAAHDIGHALQSMALVGCTSFGTWGSRSADSTMIIGRNFDFYVGDEFAKEKIVAFVNPSKGYKFMSITWGGFVGVVSGMNEKGLTVTINAAKTSIPSGSATPVSLVAREILQYATNIEEAVSIAKTRTMFVSESFLVGSAEDGKAVVIEKTPGSIDVYDPNDNYILCSNHFQSKGLKNTPENIAQVNESASYYRYQRLSELLKEKPKNSVQSTIEILRDREGIRGKDIGMGNEKAINQLIAHHSIVFEPKKLLVWVSTSDWQLGPFVAYDLKKVFSLKEKINHYEIYQDSLNIPADPFLMSPEFKNFVKFRTFKQAMANGMKVNIDSLVASNPEYYHTYVLAGDQLFDEGNYSRAFHMFKVALEKVIATKKEEEYIKDRINECSDKIDK